MHGERRRSAFVSAALLASIAAAACPAEEPEPPAPLETPPPPGANEPATRTPLTLGITPYLDKQDLRTAFRPLLEYLRGKVARPVDLYIGDAYDDLLAKLGDGSVDLAMLTPYAYVMAKRAEPTLQLVCTSVVNGKPWYEGFLLTLKRSGLETLSDLAGKTICYVSRGSASGYVFPRAAVMKAGVDPDSHFGRAIFAGTHTAALEALLDGKCDAAAVYDAALDKAFEDHAIGRTEFRTVLSTGHIPGDAFVIRREVPLEAQRRLKRAMAELTPAEARRIHLTSKYALNGGCKAATDEDYDAVREVERYLGK